MWSSPSDANGFSKICAICAKPYPHGLKVQSAPHVLYKRSSNYQNHKTAASPVLTAEPKHQQTAQASAATEPPPLDYRPPTNPSPAPSIATIRKTPAKPAKKSIPTHTSSYQKHNNSPLCRSARYALCVGEVASALPQAPPSDFCPGPLL